MTVADSRRTSQRYTFEQFTAIRRYMPTLSFSPDGSEVAYSVNISGQYNLWRQSSSGGYPHQMTLYSEQAVREVQWSPDGQWILFTADYHGDEFHQIYRIPARGGQPEQLTNTPQVQHYLGQDAWTPDGSAFAYSANDRTPAEQDVLVYDTTTGEARRVYQGDAMYFAAGWSPDGKRLSIVDAKSNTNQDIYVIDPETGEADHLTPRDGEVKNFPGPWAGDGTGFYILSDEDREFLGLAFQDIKTGQKTWVETPEWDIEFVAVSPDGRFLVWVVNEGGYSRLYARDLTTNEPVTLPEVPGGVIRHLTTTRDGRKIGLLLDRPDQPTEIYVVDIDEQTVTQLTWSFLGGVDPADLIQPETIAYPTHDGREIPAFLYKPKGDGPFPVVLSIHGGPEAQERPLYMYAGLYQYWLSRGIGVLAPNVRGSTGYGSTYQKLIHRDWGGAELKDFEAGVLYLHGLDWVDNERIGVFGGSFGGFATLSCVSRLPQYFAAGVDIVGPSNLVTFARAVPPTWRRLMTQWVGDPDTEADFLMERSPITYVDQIQAPLFVIQGAQDPRVVKPESDQIVERLRARGVEVRYDVYEDEGHGFTKRENELKAMKDTALFMEEHLLRDA